MIKIDKLLLRTQYQALRKLNPTNKECDQKIAQNVMNLINSHYIAKYANASHLESLSVGLYYPMAGEPDIRFLFNHFKNISFPKINGSHMDFIAVKDPTDIRILKFNKFKTLEPVIGDIVEPNILLVPGLVFDMYGGRVGMGQGCYDQYITAHFNRIECTIGVCYNYQIIQNRSQQIATEPHDQKMDYMISESGVCHAVEDIFG